MGVSLIVLLDVKLSIRRSVILGALMVRRISVNLWIVNPTVIINGRMLRVVLSTAEKFA